MKLEISPSIVAALRCTLLSQCHGKNSRPSPALYRLWLARDDATSRVLLRLKGASSVR
jgi:hypothetical protein